MGKTLTLEEVRSKFNLANNKGASLKLVSYVGMQEKAIFQCKTHGKFSAKALNVLHNGSGCPQCWAERRGPIQTKTHDQYVFDVAAKYGDQVTVVGRYVGAITKIMHKCPKGHNWFVRPNDVLTGFKCPRCDTSSYRRKHITIGGKDFVLQGVEPFALRDLVNRFGTVAVSDSPPKFPYRHGGKTRKYDPDFQVGKRGIVEVKSPGTLGIYESHLLTVLKKKRRAVVAAGFKFVLMVYSGGSGKRYKIPRNWYEMTAKQLRKIINEQDEVAYRRKRDL